MLKAANTYTAVEMLDAMRKNSVEPDLILTCGIKPDEKDEKQIMISMKASCSNWISIPAGIISSVEYIRRFSCGDHSHPVARLVFQKASNPEARAFAALAAELTDQSYARDFEKLPNSTGNWVSPCLVCLNKCTEKPTREERLACYETCGC